MAKHYDLDDLRIREFIMLSDYFNTIYSRSFVYFSNRNVRAPKKSYEIIEAHEPVRELLNVQRYYSVKGPQMNGIQKRKYNENLKNRFHMKGADWDSWLFSEFRGINTV